MARLSKEHYRDSPATPSSTSGRFKNVFRRRMNSTSISKSPMSPSIIGSPLPSPTVKPGFDTVGLLPSERTSLDAAKHLLDENGGNMIKQAIERDMAELSSKPVPRKSSAGVNLSSEFKIAQSASPSAPETAQSSSREDEVFTEAWENLSVENDNAFIDFDQQQSFNHSHESSIPDARNSSKQCMKDAQKTVHKIRLTIPGFNIQATVVIAPQSQAANKKKVVKKFWEALDRFLRLIGGPKSIGSYSIEHDRVAGFLQLAVIIVYTLLVFIAALRGPKTLFITLWKTTVVLLGYAFVLKFLPDHERDDVLLAPIFYIGFVLRTEAIETMQNMFARILAETMVIEHSQTTVRKETE